MPEYNVEIVPDIILPDGTVVHGQAPRAILLRNRRRQVWEDARRLAVVATAQDRLFTENEQQRWDWLLAELDQLDKYIRGIR